MLVKLIVILTGFSSVICTSEEVGLGTCQTLTDGNWKTMLEGEWLVKFYAPWCPACRHLETTWESLSKWSLNRGFKVASVDVTKQSGLSGRFIITSLPTIYHVKNGIFRQYTGMRSLEELQSFMTDEKWKTVEPVSQWKSPSSFFMSCISQLFEVSMQLKDLHNSLTESYGLPVWASFVIFGVLIIIIGLLLGMGMVLASDYFFGPPCPPSYPTMAELPRDEPVTEDMATEEEEEPSVDKSGSEELICNEEESKGQEMSVRKRKQSPAKADLD